MTQILSQTLPPEPVAEPDPLWAQLVAARHACDPAVAASPMGELYLPLCAGVVNGPMVIGHLAQSLDGCIATAGGMSRWLSGDADLLHTHRMRALADAVVVGANTVLCDDPQLTVRRCEGKNPVRVVIDPEGRLPAQRRLFQDGAAPTLVLTAADRPGLPTMIGQAQVVPLPRGPQGLDPHQIRHELVRRGLNWLFIEGGGNTVSRFLAAGALDRLQITVAPLIIGSGRPGIQMPRVDDLRDSLRPRTRRFVLGDDIMIECDFRA